MTPLYEAMLAARVPCENHESDLYVPDTETARAILKLYPMHDENSVPFKSATDGTPWIDIPFAYDPHWATKGPAPF